MRHKKRFNHLGRKSAHRKAMLSNMASSLILHKRIKTTKAKAKALRMYVEPLITKAKHSITIKTDKQDATHLRRIVFSYLKQKEAVTELFREIAPKVESRNGGYTRILKIGNRMGDNAEMVYIELVDYNENMLAAATTEKKEEKKTTRRSRSKSGAPKQTTPKAEAPQKEEPKAEEKAEVKPKKETKTSAAAKKTEAKEKAPAAAKEEKKKTAPKAKKTAADDLRKIEGIGPKIAEVLANAGLATYAQLAESSADAIRKILDEAEGNFASHDPSTWAEQAKLAADGKWDELKKWQDELDGGKPAENKK